MGIRDTVLASVQLLASAAEQREYEREVPLANVPSELGESGWDLFQPKNRDYIEAFSDDELRDLAHLYGLICEATRVSAGSVAELQKTPEWRRVMAVAKDIVYRLTV